MSIPKRSRIYLASEEWIVIRTQWNRAGTENASTRVSRHKFLLDPRYYPLDQYCGLLRLDRRALFDHISL
jgi:hypothetical protein